MSQVPAEATLFPEVSMPHTVQAYSLTDPAPTYGNANFSDLRASDAWNTSLQRPKRSIQSVTQHEPRNILKPRKSQESGQRSCFNRADRWCSIQRFGKHGIVVPGMHGCQHDCSFPFICPISWVIAAVSWVRFRKRRTGSTTTSPCRFSLRPSMHPIAWR